MSDEAVPQVQVNVQPVAVAVTLDTIYKEVLETKQLLAPLPDKVTDHETRLRLLEAFKNRAAGVGTVAVLFSGVVGALSTHLFK